MIAHIYTAGDILITALLTAVFGTVVGFVAGLLVGREWWRR